MPTPSNPPHDDPVRLSNRVLDILHKLPPKIGESLRRDTEAVLRKAATAQTADPHPRVKRDRRGAWVRRSRVHRCQAADFIA